jgi:transposase-like protein
MTMEKIPRKAYTLEFKREAVRLVESGQPISEAARSLGVVGQTLSNWSGRIGRASCTVRGTAQS